MQVAMMPAFAYPGAPGGPAGRARPAYSSRRSGFASWQEQPAQVLAVTLQLQPPPEHGGGRDLAGMHERGRALRGPVYADAQVDVVGRLAGERPAGFLSQPAGNGVRQGPG